jgi:copper chaperone CopZ
MHARSLGRGRLPFKAFWLASLPGVVLLFVGACATDRRQSTAASGNSSLVNVVVPVEGMTCASCTVAVKTALKRIPGVHTVEVSLEKKQAAVSYDATMTSPGRLVDAINSLGYRAAPPAEK